MNVKKEKCLVFFWRAVGLGLRHAPMLLGASRKGFLAGGGIHNKPKHSNHVVFRLRRTKSKSARLYEQSP
jgi:hypothetical protein